MPVKIEEVTRASRPLEERILEVLREVPPDEALTLPEIYSRLEGADASVLGIVMAMSKLYPDRFPDQENKWLAAMNRLVQTGHVRRGELRGEAYYWCER